jgi:glyoxylase-like metal-dependent hydrolase (beta-lactamase superfamily II)
MRVTTPKELVTNTSRQWTGLRPINRYVIEHGKRLVLFDTGRDRRSVTDPGCLPGGMAGLRYRRLAEFGIPSDATLTDRRGDQGHDIADVRVAIVSHLHQDHICGLRGLPRSAQALVTLQRAEAPSHLPGSRSLPPRGQGQANLLMATALQQHGTALG